MSNNERLLAHTVSKAISQFSTENNLGSGSISANLTDATNMDTTITSDSTLGYTRHGPVHVLMLRLE